MGRNDQICENYPSPPGEPFDFTAYLEELKLPPTLSFPTSPDAGGIHDLHRHTDGFITFHSNREGKWRDLFACTPRELEAMFPEFQSFLEVDSYHSINAFKSKRRGNARLKRLTAVYTDIDCHALGIPIEKAAGLIAEWEASPRGIPISAKKFSGRGIWLFWLLHDGGGNAIDATPQAVGMYGKVQRAINYQFTPLGADKKAIDPARVTRIPGSTNSKVEKPVIWYPAFVSNRLVFYSLDQLAEWFNVPAIPWVEPRTTLPARKYIPVPGISDPIRSAKRRGWEALLNYQLDDFQTLRDLRGGFRTGERHYAAMVWASLRYKGGFSTPEITREIERLIIGAEQEPPFTHKEIEHAIKWARKFPRLSYETISNWLNITKAEAAMLVKFPPAGTPTYSIENTRDQKAELRRMHIEELVSSVHRGRVPPIRVIREYLIEHGCSASTRTIHTDLKAMRLRNPRAKQGKLKF